MVNRNRRFILYNYLCYLTSTVNHLMFFILSRNVCLFIPSEFPAFPVDFPIIFFHTDLVLTIANITEKKKNRSSHSQVMILRTRGKWYSYIPFFLVRINRYCKNNNNKTFYYRQCLVINITCSQHRKLASISGGAEKYFNFQPTVTTTSFINSRIISNLFSRTENVPIKIPNHTGVNLTVNVFLVDK